MYLECVHRQVCLCIFNHRANLTPYKFVRGRAKFELRAIYLIPKHFFLSNTAVLSSSLYVSSIFIEISYLLNKTEGESTGTRWVLLLKETS